MKGFSSELPIGRVDACSTGMIDQKNVISIAPAAVLWSIHPWGSNGHSRHSQADNFGAFSKQALDFTDRHVSFDGVPTHLRRVTGAVATRQAQSRPRVGIALRGDLNVEAGTTQ